MGEQRLPARYSSVSHLASGGMGDVYRATDGVLGRTVAVKVLAERHARNPDVRSRFTREAQAAARLSMHPNVVTVFDVGEHDGRPFIVMEYLAGGSVYDRIRASRVPTTRALGWLEQAASALDAAHAKGVVHRDVKPANLLLDDEGRIRVTDFGIASATGLDALTMPGTVLGTAGYLSPEQARGETATDASDRYALGIVAFELLTWRRPFAGDTPATEAFAHIHAEVPSAAAIDPALPPRVDAVFRRALAKDPSARPASARELVAELRDALAGDDASTPTVVLPRRQDTQVVHRTRRASRVPLVAVALTALLVAAFVAVALVGSGDDRRPEAAARQPQSGVTTSTDASTTTTDDVDGVALNAQGFELLQAGDPEAALPLLRSAVVDLKGSGVLTEAYASYNLAYARFASGRCDGVLGLLDRSERIQGERREIDELRGAWEARCAPAASGSDEDERPGKSRGKKKGQSQDD